MGGLSRCVYTLRGFLDIQRRGRWDSVKSVARCKKSGMYLQQVARLTRVQRSKAQSLLTSLPRRLHASRKSRAP
eukprot:487587-Heterocapsa_arctica.AAC.1